jgi:transcriptional regulator MraZ
MSSFYGTDLYSIDHKGRIAIPPSMRRGPTARKSLTSFFVNTGFERCVAVWSLEEWSRMMGKLRRIPPGNVDGRRFRRAFMTDAREVPVDGQGRITIPPALLRRADLGKEAVLHGAEDHIEIWNPDRFRQVVGPVLDVEGEYERLAALHLKDEAP